MACDFLERLRTKVVEYYGKNNYVTKGVVTRTRDELLKALKARFEKNMNRHKGLEWAKVQAKLQANTEKLWSLNEIERTGGEPDVVGFDKTTAEYIFYDCSAESPKGRRGVCYDREALESRKEHKQKNSAIDMAAAMGIELLTEEEYRELQKLGNFDAKTSSWVKTPSDIRKLGPFELGFVAALAPIYLRAQAYVMQNLIPQAIKEFERLLAHRGRSILGILSRRACGSGAGPDARRKYGRRKTIL